MVHYNVSFAGAGRVAGALCRKMHSSGITIRQIVSLNAPAGKSLAAKCKASWSDDLTFSDPVDLIIVSVPDHSLQEVLFRIKCPRSALVAHTAGSYGLDVFPASLKNRGVFYPLQTFSEKRRVNFNGIPFLIEASDSKLAGMLKLLGEKLGGRVYSVDAGHRKLLHLAAVFACNFANHMLTAGKEITARAGFSFDVLEPLIRETISKALADSPELSQTGPAVRNDRNTIEKHMDLLSFSPDLQLIYREVTRSIIEHYKNKQ